MKNSSINFPSSANGLWISFHRTIRFTQIKENNFSRVFPVILERWNSSEAFMTERAFRLLNEIFEAN